MQKFPKIIEYQKIKILQFSKHKMTKKTVYVQDIGSCFAHTQSNIKRLL